MVAIVKKRTKTFKLVDPSINPTKTSSMRERQLDARQPVSGQAPGAGARLEGPRGWNGWAGWEGEMMSELGWEIGGNAARLGGATCWEELARLGEPKAGEQPTRRGQQEQLTNHTERIADQTKPVAVTPLANL